ncbi:ankyrin repeat-containing protein BDA1-like isoform X2 [Andrographis paniculata]|uniref:ankyrin repeat-containing protein BDA1-like isoform X2 n=1 Tax=Andrographis paniculata TaxID=175694 RepID=UPI0021E7AC0B|nr:ankyrin repeat-containing protein BDA1-like isoform X2 [Andrographis paniculata]
MMEDLEKKLYDAAVEGNTKTLQELLRQDPIILERAVANCFSETPLHVAAMLGHSDFVREIVRINPRLTNELNSMQSTPLHLASAKGHVEVVRILIYVDPQTCLARDRNQMTALHLAALKGRIEVVKVLLGEKLDAAQLSVHKGENILHLCVKHHQLEALKLLLDKVSDEELVNAKDSDGNTLLHLAVAHKQTIEFLLGVAALDANAKNLNRMTALDILIQSRSDLRDAEILESLRQANVDGVQDYDQGSRFHQDSASQVSSFLVNPNPTFPTNIRNKEKYREDWLEEMRSALMIVASLIATMAFQVGVNPPGGLWQDDSKPGDQPVYKAGFSIFARNYPEDYVVFYIFNTISLISSLSIILLLISGLPVTRKLFVWILMVVTWIAITATALTYSLVISAVTPAERGKSMENVIRITILVWIVLMVLLLIVHTMRLIVKIIKKLKERLCGRPRMGSATTVGRVQKLYARYVRLL